MEIAKPVGLPLQELRFGVEALGDWHHILDGAKALHAAVRRHAGEAAFVRRCQVHEKRKVLDHLPEEHKPAGKRKLQAAYAMTDYEEAKRALERLHRELMDPNPSAARSLSEGMKEMLTLQRL